MKQKLLPSLVAGVVLFIWGFISWTVLPWHDAVANKFVDEVVVSQILKDNSPQSGVYYLPFSPEDHTPDRVGAFVNVTIEGMDMNMGRQMAIALLTQIIGAFLVLTLLGTKRDMSYGCKVGFFSLVGLTIGFVSHAPYWNWFGFSTPYTAVMIADSMIAWTLAGLVAARLTGSKFRRENIL